jgi:hypothetical protein
MNRDKPTSSSGGGYKPLHDEIIKQEPERKQETPRERLKRQQLERRAELNYTPEDYARWEENRERVIRERIGPTPSIEERLSDSIGLQCSLEEELAKNHQHVLIADLKDAHKILHNVWLESGKDAAAIAVSINNARSLHGNFQPLFDARSIAKQFGDMGVKADVVESKGKLFVAFNGTDKNGKVLKHAFVNGTRINMNEKKYPLNSFKSMQAGFSPKAKAANFKGAAALTFVVSASIATTDLVFKDDYHLVDWFGNVGADMFKALVQFGAGEAVLLLAASANLPILAGAALVFAAYVGIEAVWGLLKISNKIVEELESATEN